LKVTVGGTVPVVPPLVPEVAAAPEPELRVEDELDPPLELEACPLDCPPDPDPVPGRPVLPLVPVVCAPVLPDEAVTLALLPEAEPVLDEDDRPVELELDEDDSELPLDPADVDDDPLVLLLDDEPSVEAAPEGGV
jgi:hypothetical protein